MTDVTVLDKMFLHHLKCVHLSRISYQRKRTWTTSFSLTLYLRPGIYSPFCLTQPSFSTFKSSRKPPSSVSSDGVLTDKWLLVLAVIVQFSYVDGKGEREKESVTFFSGCCSGHFKALCAFWRVGTLETSHYYYYYYYYYYHRSVVMAFSSLSTIWGKVWRFISHLFYFFFFKVEISSHTPLPVFRPRSIHSGSVSWDDCGRIFPDELHVSLFPW